MSWVSPQAGAELATADDAGSAQQVPVQTVQEDGSTWESPGAISTDTGISGADAWGETVQRAEGSSVSGSAAAGAGTPGSGGDLDELAGKLYDRIRSRLRGELLFDRERAGLLIDL